MPVNNIPGPLEHLTAFAIVFVAGIFATAVTKAYIEWEREIS